jgi:CubicO group peptidase (beta-lactamase class C family)
MPDLATEIDTIADERGFLAELDGHPTKFPPDERFSYCNGGYMVLALIAERVSGLSFHQLVRDRVCTRAGMVDTDFLRSDELPDRTAYGYLPTPGASRTNVFHLPILGNGDGGVYTTAADVSTFWRSLFAGRIVSAGWVSEMVRPRSEVPEESMRYGLGFWLHESSDAVILIGEDAGVSFRSVHDPRSRLTHTVISNSSDGAWPVTRRLDELLSPPPRSDRVTGR